MKNTNNVYILSFVKLITLEEFKYNVEEAYEICN